MLITFVLNTTSLLLHHIEKETKQTKNTQAKAKHSLLYTAVWNGKSNRNRRGTTVIILNTETKKYLTKSQIDKNVRRRLG